MISASMIAWGLLTVLTALVRTPGQLYAARFLLGAAEGGFFPGVVVYLSHWFIREAALRRPVISCAPFRCLLSSDPPSPAGF